MERQKIIFLSDIHIGNDAQCNWFLKKDSDLFTKMLDTIAMDPGVKELVFLGDIFDLWLFPVNEIPLAIGEIIEKWHGPVIDSIKKCVERIPNVYFIPGNHDISVDPSDIGSISSNGKKLEWVTPETYNKKYIVDNKELLHVEHGNSVDIFNAPYEGDDGLGDLPLGYFLTRIYASMHAYIKTLDYKPAKHNRIIRKIENNLKKGYRKTLKKNRKYYVKKKDSGAGKIFINAVIDIAIANAQKCGKITDDSIIYLPGQGNTVTVGEVRKHYHGLLELWCKKWGLNILDCLLVSMQENGLDWYANHLVKKGRGKVIIFGHTHHRDMHRFCLKGYTNTGCWCSHTKDKGPAYVEVKIHPHTIEMSLWQWNGSGSKRLGTRKIRY